mmetsp:Transcript_17302/g.44155  ORF Transcript_17302/g.44155 Transcript_17302/m.44155 type:complete len:260 (-) Transcript_17302:150-929(-)
MTSEACVKISSSSAARSNKQALGNSKCARFSTRSCSVSPEKRRSSIWTQHLVNAKTVPNQRKNSLGSSRPSPFRRANKLTRTVAISATYFRHEFCSSAKNAIPRAFPGSYLSNRLPSISAKPPIVPTFRDEFDDGIRKTLPAGPADFEVIFPWMSFAFRPSSKPRCDALDARGSSLAKEGYLGREGLESVTRMEPVSESESPENVFATPRSEDLGESARLKGDIFRAALAARPEDSCDVVVLVISSCADDGGVTARGVS